MPIKKCENSLNIRDAGSWYAGWAIKIAHPDFAGIENRTETKIAYLPIQNLVTSSAFEILIKSKTEIKLVLWRTVEYEHPNLGQNLY